MDKPFAVMVDTLASVRQFAVVDDTEAALLESNERPIVLLRKKTNCDFDSMLEAVAPGNAYIGVMLPYSPLHYLLVGAVSPLVVTSGNIADEPIARTNFEAVERLANLADSFLFHNRKINVVCDDSIVRRVGHNVLPIRRSRGYAPTSIRLDANGPSVLAVGGELKAAFCVTKQDYAYLSQHLGDVENLETLESLERNVDHFLQLFAIDLDAVAGDRHPGYLSSQWAERLASRLGVPYLPIQHHHAHAVSLLAEQSAASGETFIACCFDGTGYGDDQAIWGGEFLIASAKHFQRFAHLRYFPLLGGDASIKHPYRVALSLLSSCDLPWNEQLPCVSHVSAKMRELLRIQRERKINFVLSSSMGRLFDAISSLIGLRHSVSYEAQAALELEAVASESIDRVDPHAYSFDIQTTPAKKTEIDFNSLVQSICHDVLRGDAPCLIAARFHHAVARMIIEVCEAAREQTEQSVVGLTGGVFQNALLTQLVSEGLRASGFQVLTHSFVPPNDGGLALGQAVIARHQLPD